MMKRLSKHITIVLALVLGLVSSGILTFTNPTFTAPTYAVDGDGEPSIDDEAEAERIQAEKEKEAAEKEKETSETKKPDSKLDEAEAEKQQEENQAKAEEEAKKAEDDEDKEPACQGQAGSLSWIICSAVNVSSNLVDTTYSAIEKFLVVKPIASDDNSAIYRVWTYMRDLTNIIFIIFIIIVIYSQITGLGINNYGIKRVLPRLIIAVILVNLSFLISAIAVDVSNIVGSSISNTLSGIQNSVLQEIPNIEVKWSDFANYLVSGIAVGAIGIVAAEGVGAIFWMFALALIGGVLSLAVGLITISLRQGLVYILVMISPLAFVAYLLPNTEKWFEKWKNLLFQMLFFYPMFAFLFSASKLAGWAIIASAKDSMFEVLLGIIIQVMPLFLSASLMKMSGTILGKINGALNNLTNPIRRTAALWTGSHAEKNRQLYRANNRYITGARLRKYLETRQRQREADAMNAKSIADGRIAEDVNKRLAGYIRRDAYGREVYRSRANAAMRRAKTASLQKTLTDTSQRRLESNLSEFGDLFKNQSAKKIAAEHAEAFVDLTTQNFRAANIAQADQNYLLNRFIAASKHRSRSPYEFNRLIGNARGGLGVDGENTIMGQVLRQSVENEGRNRRDAIVVANKFNFSKPEFRRFVFDKYDIGDNGRERDENGNYIEDDQYKYVEGGEAKHREYDKYFVVHKETGKEISKETYNNLSEARRKDYKRVRYMDIYDDDGDVIQRFTENDAGYMKEMLARDIAICDPINDRYNISYGYNGPLRRYHSTISAAMVTAKYKEHSAAVGNMLLQQLNMGYVDTMGKHNIAMMQALSVAAKPKDFLINDKDAHIRLQNILKGFNDPELFAKLFPDEDILGYLDVNGKHLDGYRYNQGSGEWEEIAYADSSIEDLRNTIKHKIMPKLVTQLVRFLQTEPTPNIRENQKASGIAALIDLSNTVGDLVLDNFDENKPFEERLDPNSPLINAPNSADTSVIMKEVVNELERIKGKLTEAETALGKNNPATQKLNQDLAYNAAASTASGALDSISDLVHNTYTTDPNAITAAAVSIFSENEYLRTFLDRIEEIQDRYKDLPNGTNVNDEDKARAEQAKLAREDIEVLYNEILGNAP